MQSYLYIHEERIKSIYAQYANGLQTKKSSEKAESLEGGVTGGFFSFLKSSAKGSKSGKSVVETVDTPVNMVADLIKIVPETGFTKSLVAPEDWQFITQGSLVVFRGDLEFDSFGLSKGELWDASYDEIGKREVRHDLRLKGNIAGKLAEVAFSSNYVTGPSQFTVLCHAMFDHLEGLAVVIGDPNKEPVMLQPLAFGNGFIE